MTKEKLNRNDSFVLLSPHTHTHTPTHNLTHTYIHTHPYTNTHTHTHISVTPRPLISFSPTLLSSVHLSLRHIPLSTSGSRRCHLPALTQLCPEHPAACALPSSPTLTATIFSHVTPICLSYPLSHTDRTFW